MKRLSFIMLVIFVSCRNKNGNRVIKNTIVSSKKNFTKDIIISDSTKILEPKIQTLKLQYIDWSCACANWITHSDYKRFEDTGRLSDHCIFIEPANLSLALPDDNVRYDVIKVTGQFYVRKDYPKGTIKMEENLDKAKVFRYTKIEVITKRKWKDIFK